jgi:peptide deformylase
VTTSSYCLQAKISSYFAGMIRKVVHYGHPVLRKKGERVENITPAIRALIQDLLETMYEAHGIGLAAQQIGEAVQVTVIDVRGVENRPSSLDLNGKPSRVEDFMPLVLINPEVKPIGEPAVGPEGCLSFPEIFADITRPETVEVVAMNEKGERIEFSCSGLLARAIQHEVDHLNGILFIDRMDACTKSELKPRIADIHARTKKTKHDHMLDAD